MFTLAVLATGALALFGGWTLKTYLEYRHRMNAIDWLPGPKYFFSESMSFARLLPNIPYVNRKLGWPWELKYDRRISYL